MLQLLEKPMRHALAALIACLSLTTTAQAACDGPSLLDRFSPADQAALADRAAATAYGTGLVWTATKDSTTLTLAGTMHLPDPRHAALRDRLAPMIATADLLLVEATPEDQSAMVQALSQDQSIAFITDGPTLPDLLPEETWSRVGDAMRARQMPQFMAARMQPWYLGLTLSIAPCAIADVASGAQGLDFMLMDVAKAAGTPIAPVEDWRMMLDLLSEGTFDEQVEMLELSLHDPSIADEMHSQMIDDYFAGDIARIWELSRASVSLMPLDAAEGAALFAELDQTLLVDRNHAWMPVILEAAAAHDTVVIAVGAAHMIGETGLPRLLEADGWVIEPAQ